MTENFITPTAPFIWTPDNIQRIRSPLITVWGCWCLGRNLSSSTWWWLFLHWDRFYMYLDTRHDSNETSSCAHSPAWRSNSRNKAAAFWQAGKCCGQMFRICFISSNVHQEKGKMAFNLHLHHLIKPELSQISSSDYRLVLVNLDLGLGSQQGTDQGKQGRHLWSGYSTSGSLRTVRHKYTFILHIMMPCCRSNYPTVYKLS